MHSLFSDEVVWSLLLHLHSVSCFLAYRALHPKKITKNKGADFLTAQFLLRVTIVVASLTTLIVRDCFSVAFQMSSFAFATFPEFKRSAAWSGSQEVGSIFSHCRVARQ